MSGKRLSREKSPYLLQHADNPVDWYSWGPEAFEQAATLDRPIFLSIGYATCHWCHVMAHESFEDVSVARLLNEYFVSIKVDREERPDVDQVYMTACQMLSGRGGWPLTAFLTPEREPFFVTTYLPRDSRFGQPGMLQILPRMADLWRNDRDRLLNAAGEIVDVLVKEAGSDTSGPNLDYETIYKAYDELSATYDAVYGGFGTRPKFPSPHTLSFLLRHIEGKQRDKAVRMARDTLAAMRAGGIFDHLGFGFHRYSTDQEWLLPHFEKMLYDQAGMVLAYLDGFQVTGEEVFRQTVEEVLTYVQRDMTQAGGGFFSAEDADSEGEEGKFYVWTEEEIRTVLPEDSADLFCRHFGIERRGNFADESSGSRTGANILHRPASVWKHHHAPEKATGARLESAREQLLAARSQRIRPLLDDKILTDWNGFMIGAMARAGNLLDQASWIDTAADAAVFIRNRMQTEDGRLMHRYREGDAAVAAYLDDYAYYIFGLIELYRATYQPSYLGLAVKLAKTMCALFEDPSGGFFFIASDAEALPARMKETYDGAIPSGNSMALHVLVTLFRYTGDTRFDEAASRAVTGLAGSVHTAPSGHTFFLSALATALKPSVEVTIAGAADHRQTRKMLAHATESVGHGTAVLLKTERTSGDLAACAPFTAAQHALDGKPTAYVCENHVCNQPTVDPDEMRQLLEAAIGRQS